jgi:uncharacterized protein
MTGENGMERTNQKGFILGVLFLIMTFLFTRGFFVPFFVLLIALLLLIAFFNEERRLIAWMIISFFLGNLLLVYTDNYIESFHLSPYSLVMTSQLLLLIPILMISYVIKQFKQVISPYLQKPILKGEIKLPFSIVFSLRKFCFFLCLFSTLSVIGLLLLKREELHWRPFLFILLFSSIHALLEEVLWRGLLLSKLITITNQRLGIVITSIAFGINTTMFGFSIMISIFYIFIALFFGFLTFRFKSIFPSVIVHFSVTTILLLLGWIVIPL